MSNTDLVLANRSHAEGLSGDELLEVVYDLLGMIPFVPCYDCGKQAVGEFNIYRKLSAAASTDEWEALCRRCGDHHLVAGCVERPLGDAHLDPWVDDCVYPSRVWKDEVADDNTRSGYLAWVAMQHETLEGG